MTRVANTRKLEVFDASGYRVGLVAARFGSEITEAVVERAIKKLDQYKVKKADTRLVWVAGSVEIPLMLKKLAESKFDCLVAIGAVIRGETAHFDYVSKIVSEGVLRVQLDFGIPVGFGVLTTANHEQALKRLNSGADAAEAALQSARLIKEF